MKECCKRARAERVKAIEEHLAIMNDPNIPHCHGRPYQQEEIKHLEWVASSNVCNVCGQKLPHPL